MPDGSISSTGARLGGPSRIDAGGDNGTIWSNRGALIVLCCGCLLLGCGGRSLGGDRGGDGGGGQDAAVVVPDGGTGGAFCEGVAKAELGETLVAPAVVTSTPVAMGCCDGAAIRFHTTAELGFDVSVFIRAQAQWAPGDYVLEQPPNDLEVTVHRVGDPTSAEQVLSGSLSVHWSGDWEEPIRASLCAEVSQPGAVVDGMRLFVDHLVVAAWSWGHRFTIHILEDPELSAQDAAELQLNALTLNTLPVVSLDVITYYAAQAHTLHWEPWYTGNLQSRLPAIGAGGLPFVVVVDGERIYLGAFFSALSSATFPHPVIIVDEMTDEAVTIEAAYPPGTPGPSPDPRADPRLFDLLREAAKLGP